MNNKHGFRLLRGFLVSIIPITLVKLVIDIGISDFFRLFFIMCLACLGTYVEGLLIEKFYMKK